MNIIESLEAKKIEVRQRAEAYCAKIDSVLELFHAEAVDNPPSTELKFPVWNKALNGPVSGRLKIAAAKGKTQERDREPAKKKTPKRNTGNRPKGVTVPVESLSEASRDWLKTVSTLPQPFGSEEIMKSCDMLFKNASNWLLRSAKRGWIKRVGFGKYERTEEFPDVKQLQALDEVTKTIRQETDQAIAKRDKDHTTE